jgi:hypothetical protein
LDSTLVLPIAITHSNSSMYDATQGNNSGAHISVLTKPGTTAVSLNNFDKTKCFA